MSLPGRIRHFSNNWEKFANNKKVLDMIGGLKLKFLEKPYQTKNPKQINMLQEEKLLVEYKIQELLKKGAIKQTSHSQNQFISNIFLREKKDGCYLPVMVQMDGLNHVKKISGKKDLMLKLDLQDTYVSIPLHRNSRKYVEWKGKFLEFNTSNFYKTSKNTNILNAKRANPSCNIPRRSLGNEGGSSDIFCYLGHTSL